MSLELSDHAMHIYHSSEKNIRKPVHPLNRKTRKQTQKGINQKKKLRMLSYSPVAMGTTKLQMIYKLIKQKSIKSPKAINAKFVDFNRCFILWQDPNILDNYLSTLLSWFQTKLLDLVKNPFSSRCFQVRPPALLSSSMKDTGDI